MKLLLVSAIGLARAGHKDLVLENLALRQQLRVLQRTARRVEGGRGAPARSSRRRKSAACTTATIAEPHNAASRLRAALGSRELHPRVKGGNSRERAAIVNVECVATSRRTRG